jgi:hypothetical protein
MLLAASGVTTSALRAPAGWTLVATQPNSVMSSAVWARAASASDAGSQITVTFPAKVQGTVQLAAYSGVDPTRPVAVVAGSATHATATAATTPGVSVGATGQWLVSYWSVKSSSVSGWIPPAAALVRSAQIGAGGGRVSALLADSGQAIPAGAAGKLTARTDQSFSASDTMSILLAPAP